MALIDLFKKAQYSTVSPSQKQKETEMPDGLFEKCTKCQKPIFIEKLQTNHYVCPECNAHFRIGAKLRIEYTADNGSFVELFDNLQSSNPIGFKIYEQKIISAREKSGISEAVICGECLINNKKVAMAVMDSNFMMGSMGSVVGERITRLIEHAIENRLPVIIFTCSGGARMHEGIFSLMQMAKISAALKKLSDAKLPYFTVITDPTTGGVTASFAMLGDVIIAESNAVIGFAGRRVIEGTIGRKLPDDFQTAEFLCEHGFVDIISDRRDIKDLLDKLLTYHFIGGQKND